MEYINLGDVCDIIGGGTPSKSVETYYNGDILWTTVGDMQGDFVFETKLKITKSGLQNSSTNIIPTNNVIIATRVGLGKVCILKKDAAINQDLKGIVPKNSNTISNKYLFYWFKSISENIIKAGTGATVQGVKLPFVKNLQFPKTSITEQKQIVAILDQTFAAVDQAKANIEKNIGNAKELFQSKLNEIFSQKGDGWEEKTFRDLSTRIGDGLHGTPNYDESGDYYFINGNNLNNGVIEIKENTKRINHEEYLKHKRELNYNTVLVSINGTLGNVAFYNDEPVILGKSACYINFTDDVNKSYIKYLVKSPLFFENMAKQSTGATIKNSL